MSIGQWYVRRGRINRRTYWLHYFVPLSLLSIVVEVIVLVASRSSLQAASTAAAPGAAPIPTALIWLPLVLFALAACPSFSSQVTRLHDRNHSAWWLLFNLLPLVGPIVVLVQMCLPGDSGPNRYGPPPAPRHPVPDAPYPATYR